jgi:hypothetical protein
MRMVVVALLAASTAQPQSPLEEPKPDTRASVIQRRPVPSFPPDTIAEGRQDLVIADVTVDDKGEVVGVHVLRGNPEFAKSVTDSVAKWRYRPATRKGKPVHDTVPLILPFVWGRRHDGADTSGSWSEVLRAALKDPNEEVRIRTVGYLGSVPLPLQRAQASALLQSALQDQSVTVQRLAQIYLKQIEGKH